MSAANSDDNTAKNEVSSPPRIWSLVGHRVGDNAQVLALTEALNWTAETKTLEWQKPLASWTPIYGRQATLKHLAKDSQHTFAPPWPDFVISVGWRSVPVARWIKKKSGAKLVHIGRPRAPLRFFDLVLTTPQYRLPKTKNVLHLPGPMTTLSPDKLAIAADKWRQRLKHLPRPWIAVLIGGNARPFHLPASAARDLAEKCAELAERLSGSLLIATGPRTPPGTIDTFTQHIDVPHFGYEWSAERDNPYLAFIALADQFVVTNDSILMAQEAASTNRPLYLYSLPKIAGLYQHALRFLTPVTRNENSWLARLINKLVREGIIVLPRFTADHQGRLVADGRASFLGGAEPVQVKPHLENDTDQAVRAVHALLSMDNTKTSNATG